MRVTVFRAEAAYMFGVGSIAPEALDQGEKMIGDVSMWRMALLSAIFLADAVVFIGLCREELRNWRAERARRPTSRKPVVHSGQQAGAH